MALLDDALKLKMTAPQRGVCSEEELDLVIAFVNHDIGSVQLTRVLGFTGKSRTAQAYNWAASKLRSAIRNGRVSLQRR